MPKLTSGNIRIDNVRVVFPDVFEAKPDKDGKNPKFKVTALIPRDHPDLAVLGAEAKEVAEAKWGAKAEMRLKELKAGDRLPWHDGDRKTEKYDYFHGHFYVNASSRENQRPQVRDTDGSELQVTDGRPYSGCYCHVIVSLWAQDNDYGQRVNAQLLGVQFYADGERLAGGAVASDDDFESIKKEPTEEEEDTPAVTDASSLF